MVVVASYGPGGDVELQADMKALGLAGEVVAVNVEIVVDSNLNNRPTYVDFVSTVRPRNVSAS